MSITVAEPDSADVGTASTNRRADRAVTMQLVVTSIDTTVAGIRGITLAHPDGRALPGFIPGSHLVVHAGENTNAYSLTGDGTHPVTTRSRSSRSRMATVDPAGCTRCSRSAT